MFFGVAHLQHPCGPNGTFSRTRVRDGLKILEHDTKGFS